MPRNPTTIRTSFSHTARNPSRIYVYIGVYINMPRNPSTAEKYNDKDIIQSHSQKYQ